MQHINDPNSCFKTPTFQDFISTTHINNYNTSQQEDILDFDGEELPESDSLSNKLGKYSSPKNQNYIRSLRTKTMVRTLTDSKILASKRDNYLMYFDHTPRPNILETLPYSNYVNKLDCSVHNEGLFEKNKSKFLPINITFSTISIDCQTVRTVDMDQEEPRMLNRLSEVSLERF